jgi:hypothetical protein
MGGLRAFNDHIQFISHTHIYIYIYIYTRGEEGI